MIGSDVGNSAGGPLWKAARRLWRRGDEIVITNHYSQAFVYVVTGSEVVNPSDGQVVNTVDPSKATLTPVTCDPPGKSYDRLIVYADLDPNRSPSPIAGQEFHGQGVGDAATELPGDEDPGATSQAVASTPPAASELPGHHARDEVTIGRRRTTRWLQRRRCLSQG